ncbi:homoserine kinase [Altibacter sp. HG106]|uniref:homoserine kinase n=1 Tax=Altibacter sp. HG106 TaxID=3023937 RepID=UPI002350F446|nr:homoserine kinase [Altibacter sp. HG106]MDC7994374.1 homoserine kinase [Altibacter sp. HG106]
MDEIRVFAPATVANVSCGFDALGFAVAELGDELLLRKRSNRDVTISNIEGAELPTDPKKNVAGVVAEAMLTAANADFGLDIQLIKKYKPGSGLGSSAASSAGTAYGVNQLLGGPYSTEALVEFSRLGEALACGTPIADNVSAALFGGFVLVRNLDPLHVISLPTPPNLYVTLIHPQIEIKTADARSVLPRQIPLETATKQWAHVGAFVHALHTSDVELLRAAMFDGVAEPARKGLIPLFDEARAAALENGALGLGISGSGPTLFALSEGKNTAILVAQALTRLYSVSDIAFRTYVSNISEHGVRTLTQS